MTGSRWAFCILSLGSGHCGHYRMRSIFHLTCQTAVQRRHKFTGHQTKQNAVNKCRPGWALARSDVEGGTTREGGISLHDFCPHITSLFTRKGDYLLDFTPQICLSGAEDEG